MSLKFGTNTVSTVVYNNTPVSQVKYNGTTVFQSPVTYTLQYNGSSYYYSVKAINAVACGGDIVIPEIIGGREVRSIDKAGFKNCGGVKSITLPKTITTIPDEAFYGCTNLTTVKGCEGVTSIGNSAFRDCHNLVDYRFFVALKTVGEYAFLNCYQLNIETALYDTSIETINRYAFAVWKSGVTPINRTNVALPITIKSIKPEPFTHVSSMSLPYPSQWEGEEYDDEDGEYYESGFSITSTTSTTSIASWVCADAYWDRIDTITKPLVSVDSENNVISVAITNPLTSGGNRSGSVVVYTATKANPTSFTRLDSQTFTIGNKETIVTYFGGTASYYNLKIEATISGCTGTTTITEVNESYAEQTN